MLVACRLWGGDDAGVERQHGSRSGQWWATQLIWGGSGGATLSQGGETNCGGGKAEESGRGTVEQTGGTAQTQRSLLSFIVRCEQGGENKVACSLGRRKRNDTVRLNQWQWVISSKT